MPDKNEADRFEAGGPKSFAFEPSLGLVLRLGMTPPRTLVEHVRHDLSVLLQANLLTWFDRHHRDLPWRRTRDPYSIWVSEIMLQQTRVATVIPYWERWMRCFPTVERLAAADEQEVLSVWQGLGYYRRCRMLHSGARWVVAHGRPTTSSEWRHVPGVGRYTAGAIASIAFGEATPLVDGNVERVFSRLTANCLAGSALTAAAWKWAGELLHHDRPGAWNQALMELGATVCRPSAPRCEECPIVESCRAHGEGDPTAYPVRQAPRPVVHLQFHVLVPVSPAGRYGVKQIPSGRWWEGMWEFPREDDPMLLPEFGDETTPLSTVRHQVTHHRIELSVRRVEVRGEDPSLTWLDPAEMEILPMPAPQRKIYRLAREPRLF